MQLVPPSIFPEPRHDHHHCVAVALDVADALCARRGVRFTTLRRRVLELVWGRHEAVGAYVLLDALRAEGRGAAPPTIYRALDFLMEQGLIHRISHLNAYVGCARPERPHVGQFLICAKCGTAAEIDDPTLTAAIETCAASVGFTVRHPMVEIEGLCTRCGETAHGG